jgi:signal transduction histidine kinase
MDLAVDPLLSRSAVLRVSVVGFGLVVALVLLAAYLGYDRSNEIQDSAQALVREHVVDTERGRELEARIVAQTQSLLDGLVWVLGICILLAMGTAGMTVWVIQKTFAKLEWQATELAHVSWHMLDGHEKMARRFSHEMHDELGQSLTGLRGMLNRVKDSEFGSIRQECVGVVDEVLQDVRKLSQALRPVILDDFGLDSGLRWLCDRFGTRTQIPVEYKSNFSGRLAESLETHLFRITQEALTNIARHAEAKAAWVELAVGEEKVVLTITDNGKGLQALPERKNPSLGMVGMRSRARQVNGELLVENRDKGGLRIRVEAPLAKAEPSVEQEDPSIVG